jgi:hypothetical protein
MLVFVLCLNSFAVIVAGKADCSSSAESPAKGTKPLIRLAAGYSDDTTSFDPFVIYYDDNASYNFDGQYDALKIFNTDINVTNYYVYSYDNRQLSINGIPSCDSSISLQLGLKTGKDADIVFKIKDIDEALSCKTLIISDRLTGISQLIRPGQKYIVTLEAGHYTDRFSLTISDASVGLQPLNNIDADFSVFSAYGILNVEIPEHNKTEGLFTLLSIGGNVLIRKRIIYPGRYEFVLPLRNGIYIASYFSEGRICTRKIFIGSR